MAQDNYEEAMRASLELATSRQRLGPIHPQGGGPAAAALLSQQLALQQVLASRRTQQSLFGYPSAFSNPYATLLTHSTISARERQLYREQLELEQLELLRRRRLAASAALYSPSHTAVARLPHPSIPQIPALSLGAPPTASVASTVTAAAAVAARPGYATQAAVATQSSSPPKKQPTQSSSQDAVKSQSVKPSKKIAKMKSEKVSKKSSKMKKSPSDKPGTIVKKIKLKNNKKVRKVPSAATPVSIESTTRERRPTKVIIRYCWDQLELGSKYGTPAYNAYRRQEHQRLGLEPPADISALELCRKMDMLRPQSIYLPSDSPLQNFVQRTNLGDVLSPSDHEVTTKASAKGDKKTKAKRGKSDGDNGGSVADRGAHEGKLPEISKTDHSTVLHHALGRLYHTICRQDADDYSRDREKSNGWTVDLVKAKLKSYERQISSLDEREAQIVKESKLLGNTDVAGVMDDAYTLLGLAPP